MKVKQLGEGKPEYTIVGSLHGDEPCGKNAIERILQSDIEFKKPVQFIVANEEALEKNTRFIDDDLNRVFPGDIDSDSHEKKLAARLIEAIEAEKVLDIHSTQSHPEPFSTFTHLKPEVLDMIRDTGVENAVHFPEHSGTLHEQSLGIVLEAGRQGTDQAAENAHQRTLNFLAANDVIDAEYERSDPQIFRYLETVDKSEYRFMAENFKKVRKGQVYGKHESKVLKAEHDFYPVLMSTSGYDEMMGFKAEKLGRASEIEKEI